MENNAAVERANAAIALHFSQAPDVQELALSGVQLLTTDAFPELGLHDDHSLDQRCLAK